MSYLYSRALVEAYLGRSSSDGGVSAQSRSNHSAAGYFVIDRTTEPSSRSPFGTMSKPLTADHGEAVLTSFLADFPASPTQQLAEDGKRLSAYGTKCDELLKKSNLDTSLQKTSRKRQSREPQKLSSLWVTLPKQFPLERKTWVQTTFGSGIGYLPTPTTKANQMAASMMKWPSSRLLSKVFGEISPSNQEWLMGWPIGHTDLKPLETDRYQLWLQQHGEF